MSEGLIGKVWGTLITPQNLLWVAGKSSAMFPIVICMLFLGVHLSPYCILYEKKNCVVELHYICARHYYCISASKVIFDTIPSMSAS